MADLINSRRRWVGAVFLSIAVLMLIFGQTVLANSLREKVFVFYWLACFVFTGLAAITAVVDFFALRRNARKQQKEFIENAIREISERKTRVEED